MLKKLPTEARDLRDLSLIPGSGRSPGEGNGIPLQSSCLENSTGKGAWQDTVYRVVKSQPLLRNSHFSQSRDAVNPREPTAPNRRGTKNKCKKFCEAVRCTMETQSRIRKW